MLNITSSRFSASPALYYKNKIYSYADLCMIAHRIALNLQDRNIKKVAILSAKNDLVILAIIACTIAGIIFIPLNLKMPIAYNISLCKSLNVCCILYTEWFATYSILQSITQLIPIHSLLFKRNKRLCKFMNTQSDSIVTVFFTTGSTGTPKAVPLSNQNILCYVGNMVSRYPFSDKDRFIQLTEITFDPILHDLFVCWSVGACLYLFSAPSLAGIVQYIQEHRITVLTSIPSTAAIIYQIVLKDSHVLSSLRWSIFGGENLTYEFCQQWHRIAPHSYILNCYGPSEATVAVITYQLNPNYQKQWLKSGPCPIGKPFSDINTCLTHPNNSLNSTINFGECWLSGPQLSQSHLHNGAIWYRTGDLLEVNDGEFYFIGRADSQIKIRGYRVNLLEVELLLRQAAKSLAVAVIAIKSKQTRTTNSQYRLIAYISESSTPIDQIKKKIKAIAPYYMIPNEIYELIELPRKANGKIDYLKLKNNYCDKHL